MKIMYINTMYSPDFGGGAEVTLKTQVEAVKKLGHEVVVLVTSSVPGVTEDLVNGVRVIRVGLKNIYWPNSYKSPSRFEKGIWHLRDIYNIEMKMLASDIIRREAPDVISLHNLVGWSESIWGLLPSLEIPALQVLHDMYNLCPGSLMFRGDNSCKNRCFSCRSLRLFSPRLSNNVSGVVGVSRFILEKHVENGYFSEVHSKNFIHNTRNMDRNLLKNISPYKGPTRFGFIGTLAPSKGIEFLLKAFEKSFSGVELWVAGDGRPEYMEYLREKYSGVAKFFGHIKPFDFYPNISALIVPSLSEEALGMVVPEAFAFGLPVVGSLRGGIPEMIRHNENGLLFDPDVEGDIEDCISKLINNPRLLLDLGAEAKSAADPYLDTEAWAKKYIKIFSEISGHE